MNFNKEGKNFYLSIACILYDNNIIDEEEYTSRLEFCTKSINEVKFKRIIRHKFLCKFSNTLKHYRYNRKKIVQKTTANITLYKPKFKELSSWEFHKGDDDFYPSIPHGHLIADDKVKLDAYLGNVYNRGEFKYREPRESIVMLWNDEKFRKFAAESIEYYLSTHPHHNWRVSDPKRLPRTRYVARIT